MTTQQDNINQALQLAAGHHQAGRLSQAEVIYKQILAADPDNVHANHLLGILASQSGMDDLAVEFISKAIETNPGEPSYYINLGNVFLNQNKLDDALATYHKALAIKPDFPEAEFNIANTYHRQGQLDEAVAHYQKALALRPEYVKAMNNMGEVLCKQGRPDEAEKYIKKALVIDPDNAEAHNNLGKIFKDRGNVDGAVASFQKALALNRNLVEAYNNLGRIFYDRGQLNEAEASLRKALSINSYHSGAHNNLGITLKDKGNLSGAIDSFREALVIKPDHNIAHSNLLFTLNYLSNITQEEIYKESLQWQERHAKKLLINEPVHINSPEKGRRLRIGYVSPDFKAHSVASFIEPVLKAHNSESVEVFCYANVKRPDDVTKRIQAAADHWFSIAGKSDADVAARIKEDAIDILIDLAGHTGDNRLLIFARKPAPVQVTWLGYPNTTGMSAIDYRLTDAIADPVGEADKFYSEELIRMEHGFLCYQADESAPDVSTSPCLEKGFITFGSFNNLPKTTPEVVKLWSRILLAVPGSHLLLKAKSLADEEIRKQYLEMFEKEGVGADRLELYGTLPGKEDHLAFYSKIDLGLDPFPYNGTTTTCEALWMGVPVVTMRGERHSGRVGASIMHQIDLEEELVVDSADGYIELAKSLANDRDLLLEMRNGLRMQIRESKLMDSRLFTSSLEDAYRRIWCNWCDQKK